MSGLELKKLALYQLGFLDLEVPDNWTATKTYAINDMVAYSGVEYTALAINTNVIPSSDASKWSAGDELSNNALIVNDVYEEQAKYVAQEYNWNFQSKKATLVTPTSLSNEKYRYSYDLPTDFIRNINIFSNQYYNVPITDFEIDEVNQVIKCNTGTNIYIDYLYFNIDEFTTSLPIRFQNYFKYVLAQNLCMILVGDENMEKKLANLAQFYKGKAYSLDTRNVKVRRIASCDRYNLLRTY